MSVLNERIIYLLTYLLTYMVNKDEYKEQIVRTQDYMTSLLVSSLSLNVHDLTRN